MVEISAAMVRELRDRTDAPMMECKRALTEANGDLGKAEEILRVKLGNKASKAAARVAAEGIVGICIASGGKVGAMVEVNCETDFVAKNEDFIGFAQNLAKLIAEKHLADVGALSALSLDSGTVEEVRKAMVGKIGENLSIRRFARLEAKGQISQYVHGGAKIGVLVDVVGGDVQLGKDLAMHIAAAKPIALSKNHVPEEVLKKERAIAAAKAADSGKPPNIVEKMVDGSIQKFLKDITLLGQPFVKDDKLTVEALLKTKEAKVEQFVLFVVGEGIQKKTADFAAEVKAQAGIASRV